MKKLFVNWMVFGACAMLLPMLSSTALAGDLSFAGLAALFGHGTAVDVPCPQSCDQCKGEGCIERVPVKECVSGKKLVYDIKKRYEYVTIPETRYRFVTRCVTKEVKCDYCMPFCEASDVPHCYESEHWEESETACGKLHCKTCQKKMENLPCQKCGRKPGETVVKVKVRECVKEAYTVYRQVAKEICVKQPRYEHATVLVTRYECRQCDNKACKGCCDQAAGCAEAGCQ